MAETTAHQLAAIMGDIKKLPQTAFNQHGRYKYASIDDFLDTVRPLMAKHGVWIQQNEVAHEIRSGANDDGKTSSWLFMEFEFFIHGNSDPIGPTKRTAMVNAKMGAQAFGACQSYALKQFLRSAFMIATGEQNMEEGVLEPSTLAAPKNSRDPRWTGPLPKGKLQEMMKVYISRIESAETLEELEQIGDGLAVNVADLPDDPKWDGGMTFNEVVEQCKHDQPEWLNGDGMPELFVPFNDKMAEAIDRLGGNGGEN